MLIIEECRSHVANNEHLSDEDIISIREDCYGLAELAIESFLRSKKTPSLPDESQS